MPIYVSIYATYKYVYMYICTHVTLSPIYSGFHEAVEYIREKVSHRGIRTIFWTLAAAGMVVLCCKRVLNVV